MLLLGFMGQCILLPTLTKYLSCLNQFIDEVDCMVAVVGLAHHLSNSVRTDSIIWTSTREQKRSLMALGSQTFMNENSCVGLS